MKSVLISIQPKWCELIAFGKKTVEVRKTRPKLDVPFKVYIYCTSGKENLWVLRASERKYAPEKVASIFAAKDVGGAYRANGKVIGEFVCNLITSGKRLYYWHISDLVIYDKPKELSEFAHTQEYINKIRNQVSHWEYGIDDEVAKPIRRPPQSWCYVEGVN